MHNASVLGREPVTVYKKPIVLSPSEAQTTVCIEEAQSVDQLVFYSPAFEQKLHHFGPAPYLGATRRAAHMICSQIMPLTRASFLRGKKIYLALYFSDRDQLTSPIESSYLLGTMFTILNIFSPEELQA